MAPGSNDGGTLRERLVRAKLLLERERSEAPGLGDELLALSADRQREQVERDPRFQTWGFAELLLARAAALGEVDPAESGRLAGLGLAAVALVGPGAHAASMVSDLGARLWAALGEAARRAGSLEQAEEALAAAAACLADGSGDLLLDAHLLEFEAMVRADQGRTSEADALLKQAAARYASLHEDELHARAVSKRARLRRGVELPRSPAHLGYESIRS